MGRGMIFFWVIFAWLLLGWIVQYHLMGNFHFSDKKSYYEHTWIEVLSEVCLVIAGPIFFSIIIMSCIMYGIFEFVCMEFWPIVRLLFIPVMPFFIGIGRLFKNIANFLNSPIISRKKETSSLPPLRTSINYQKLANKLVNVQDLPETPATRYEDSEVEGNEKE